MFSRQITTSAGLALDTKIRAGLTTAEFTKISLGDGKYTGSEDLEKVTKLKKMRQSFGISSITTKEGNMVLLKVVVDNTGINEGYYISEAGIYARDPDKGEILYSIALGIEGKMDYQPSEAELINATSTFDFYVAVSNTESAIITIGTGAAASADDLAQLKEDLRPINTVFGTGSVSTPDAADAEIRNIVIKGRSIQDTTTGTQMLDANALASPLPGRFLLDITEKGRVIRVSSTTETSYTNAEMYDSSLIGKTFYMMVDNIVQNIVPTETLKPAFQMAVTLVDDQVVYYNLDVSSKRLITVPSDAKTVRIRLLSNNTSIAAVSDVSFIGARICLADNTLWEEYTGGKESPNPPYRQAMQSVKDLVIFSGVGNPNLLLDTKNLMPMNDRLLGWRYDTKMVRTVDEDGFAVMSASQSGLTTNNIVSALGNLVKISDITDNLKISMHIKVTDWNAWDVKTPMIYELYNKDKVRIAYRDVALTDTWTNKITIMKNNTWTLFTYERPIDDLLDSFISTAAGFNRKDTYYISIRPILMRNGEISFKFPHMELGDFSGWAPSIKDITPENRKEYLPYADKVDLSGYSFNGVGEERDVLKRKGNLYSHTKALNQKTISKSDSTSHEDSWANAAFVLYGLMADAREYPTLQTQVAPVMSDRFIADSPHVIVKTVGLNRIGIGTRSIYIGLEGIVPKGDRAACSAWIEDNPFEIIYPLKVPVQKILPDELQYRLSNLRTYSGEHSCVHVISDVTADIEVEYYRKTPISSAMFPAMDQKVVNSMYLIGKTRLVTLEASGWLPAAAPYSYSQMVAVEGLTEDMEPILVKDTGIVMTEAEKKAYNKAYAIICDADDGETSNGYVNFRVYKKPEITFNVGLKGV